MEQTTTNNSVFSTLNAVDVNGHTEKKNDLTYLSWAWAWGETVKRCPEASYEVVKDENGLPYFASPLGIMVYTRVTIGGQTREMWLPVMDNANRALCAEPKEVTDRYGKKTVIPAATMTNVNKAIMRCLTKNLAMFGLGLYIYAGEDLPEEVKERKKAEDRESLMNTAKYCDAKGLAALHARSNGDEEVRAALLARLKTLVEETKNRKELEEVYRVSLWAHSTPQLLQWAQERQGKMKSEE